ncbi:MAG TPA: glutamine cyclotransferase, partial [Erythrobacter sp.]|nr:glutamine cyclotransferase [Erythrobacter sp.]
LRAIVDSIPMTDRDTVLNGIAWDPKKRRLFVTGKRWPSLFEINLVETEAQVR